MNNLPPSFNSLEAECQYWKMRFQEQVHLNNTFQQEFSEFAEQSREMETELDATLAQKFWQINELTAKVSNLTRANEVQMLKLGQQDTMMTNLEMQLQAMSAQLAPMKEKIRKLEQTNDDLDRGCRVAEATCQGLDSMLQEEYEKTAFLELEVERDRVMVGELQRLIRVKEQQEAGKAVADEDEGPVEGVSKLSEDHELILQKVHAMMRKPLDSA